MVKDIAAGDDSSSPGRMFAFKGVLYFTVELGDDDFLWRSEGTRHGTQDIFR
jgi:hypothetical protein